MKRSRIDMCEAEGLERDAFEIFAGDRAWKYCEGFWSRLIKNRVEPDFVVGDVSSRYSSSAYGVTNLKLVRDAGAKAEFTSKNYRYQAKQTFAMRVGYDGNQYYGYQKQTKCPGLTVEGDLQKALGNNTTGAGRTDRGVSAVSQVICFSTPDMSLRATDYIARCNAAEPFCSGRLTAYECFRVPKKFHSRASATWRRYLYMFPLNRVPGAAPGSGEFDVDVEFMNRLLGRLQGKELPYNAFAYKEDRVAGQGLLDKCTLLRARATVVNLAHAVPGLPWEDLPQTIQVVLPTEVEAGAGDEDGGEGAEDAGEVRPTDQSPAEAKEEMAEGEADIREGSTIFAGGTTSVSRLQTLRGVQREVADEQDLPAICVELVGSRFLRRMVRILTATAIREATRVGEQRNEAALEEICLSGDRNRAARALPGPPLCLAGVGYDADDMALYKFQPKVEMQARMAERAAASGLDAPAEQIEPIVPYC